MTFLLEDGTSTPFFTFAHLFRERIAMIKQLAEEAKASGEDSSRTRYARPAKSNNQDAQEQIDVKLETIFLNQIKSLSADDPPEDSDESWSDLEEFERDLDSDVPDPRKTGAKLLSQALSKADEEEAEKKMMESFFRGEAIAQGARLMPLERSSFIGIASRGLMSLTLISTRCRRS